MDKIIKYILIFGVCLTFSLTNVQAATLRTGILNDNAKVRDTAGRSKVLKILSKGVVLPIIREQGEWYQVSLKNGTKGWIFKTLMDVSTTTVVKTPISTTSSSIIKVATTTKATSTEKLVSVNELSDIISTAEINKHWQDKINALRKTSGVRELVIDDRLIRTATEWAEYMGENDRVTHVRPDGKSAQQWVAGKNIQFTKRNSKDGWKQNYFVENIGLRLYIKPTAADIKVAMDGVLKRFLAEGPSGIHYRSIYHADWNSFGAGWKPIKNSKGTYTLYFAFHYGSLAL